MGRRLGARLALEVGAAGALAATCALPWRTTVLVTVPPGPHPVPVLSAGASARALAALHRSLEIQGATRVVSQILVLVLALAVLGLALARRRAGLRLGLALGAAALALGAALVVPHLGAPTVLTVYLAQPATAAPLVAAGLALLGALGAALSRAEVQRRTTTADPCPNSPWLAVTATRAPST
jgi:hypothetical protein